MLKLCKGEVYVTISTWRFTVGGALLDGCVVHLLDGQQRPLRTFLNAKFQLVSNCIATLVEIFRVVPLLPFLKSGSAAMGIGLDLKNEYSRLQFV